ncbi:unnamed protein product [Pedinophyceae sp. YPF-701]|nr:unnamed protein product [Pedinophyceae sp. YPF-701]
MVPGSSSSGSSVVEDWQAGQLVPGDWTSSEAESDAPVRGSVQVPGGGGGGREVRAERAGYLGSSLGAEGHDVYMFGRDDSDVEKRPGSGWANRLHAERGASQPPYLRSRGPSRLSQGGRGASMSGRSPTSDPSDQNLSFYFGDQYPLEGSLHGGRVQRRQASASPGRHGRSLSRPSMEGWGRPNNPTPLKGLRLDEEDDEDDSDFVEEW